MATDLTSLEGQLSLLVSMTAQKAKDLSTPQDSLEYSDVQDWTTEVDQIFHDQFTIAASGSTTIDLTTDLNPFGAALNFANISAVLIFNKSDAGKGTVVIGNATNPFQGWLDTATNTETLQAQGVFAHIDPVGWSVTSGTADEIKITNSDAVNAATVDVIILGTAS